MFQNEESKLWKHEFQKFEQSFNSLFCFLSSGLKVAQPNHSIAAMSETVCVSFVYHLETAVKSQKNEIFLSVKLKI